MTEKKKTAPSRQAGSGELVHIPAEALSSVNEYIKNFSAPQGSISSLLKRGRASAMTGKQLSLIIDQPLRAITVQIRKERKKGAPICSDPACGFWIAENEDDLAECVTALQLRALEIMKTAGALVQILTRRESLND